MRGFPRKLTQSLEVFARMLCEIEALPHTFLLREFRSQVLPFKQPLLESYIGQNPSLRALVTSSLLRSRLGIDCSESRKPCHLHTYLGR